jgi:DNA-binding NtrC family response regulator
VEPEQVASGTPVLIVSPDERWLRALEVTVRLGGYRALTRRSMADALRVRDGDELPQAVVFDLGASWSASELESVQSMIAATTIPAIVILPERLAAERDRIAEAGATTLIRPYRPSELFAVLPPHPGVSDATADRGAEAGDDTPASDTAVEASADTAAEASAEAGDQPPA